MTATTPSSAVDREKPLPPLPLDLERVIERFKEQEREKMRKRKPVGGPVAVGKGQGLRQDGERLSPATYVAKRSLTAPTGHGHGQEQGQGCGHGHGRKKSVTFAAKLGMGKGKGKETESPVDPSLEWRGNGNRGGGT
jgi:hypothetical protein